MQVILLKDVDGLGEGGEVRSVADGYARNYLLPQHLAIKASEGALNDLKMRIERIRVKIEKRHQEDLERAAKVEKIGLLTLAARAGEQGKLYGAVTTKELTRLVSEKAGMEIDRKSLKLSHPINRLGQYELQIRFSPKVSATLQVSVVPDEDSDVEASYTDDVDEALGFN